MGGRIDLEFSIVGAKEVTELLEKALPKLGSEAKVYQNAMKFAARKTVIPKAKSGYAGLGGSGSLAQAMSAYRWKKNESKYHFEVHTGPKRGNRNALNRYLAYWRKEVTPKNFRYGLRHAHLVEFGHRIVRGGRTLGRVPGRHTLERAGNASQQTLPREFYLQWDKALQQEIKRVTRSRTRERIV
jgi:hypothetical protein